MAEVLAKEDLTSKHLLLGESLPVPSAKATTAYPTGIGAAVDDVVYNSKLEYAQTYKQPDRE